MDKKYIPATHYSLFRIIVAGFLLLGGAYNTPLLAKTTMKPVSSNAASKDQPKQEDGHGHGKESKTHQEEPDKHDDHDEKGKDDHGHEAPKKDADGGHDEKGKDGHGHEAQKKDADGGHDEKGKDGHGHEAQKKDADGGHDEKNKISLTPEQMREFSIETAKVESGRIDDHIIRPAEIKFNEDRIVHVIPRVDGTVKSVLASEGQFIKKGALMAILDSRELADAKANFLAVIARLTLAKQNLERDERLSRRKILAQKQYLNTQNIHIEAQIAYRSSLQKLRALGLSKKTILKLPKADDDSLSLFRVRAPFSGVIIERHIVIGETRSVEKEALTSRKAAFVIADLSKVWVDISIFPKDFKIVKKGQEISLSLDDGGAPVTGKIIFVSPHVLEATRTGFARAIIDNSSRRLHPGVYLKVEISTGSRIASIRIPKKAVQTSERGKIVFVKEGNGFEPRDVQLGLENHTFVEVKSGLKKGETYVSAGAFTLKAQLGKAAFGDGHNH